jgi:hypothetical protein
MNAIAYVHHQERCERCLQARIIENARLAWRDLYNLRSPARSQMSFEALAAYGFIHFDSQAQCFSCQTKKVKKILALSQ